MKPSALSDEELFASLRSLCAASRRVDVQLIVHLAEVEERSLHLKAACSSMFDFCVRKLGLSEGAAHRRINAARLSRRFPTVLARLERGEVHLSGLVLVARHLTDANVEELMAAITGKSQREIEELLVRRAPKPDVPDRICRVPAQALLPGDSGGHGDLSPRPMRIAPPKRGTVARAVRREVFERDGEQCTFADADGNRCPSRTLLELDHVEARASGGADDASNLRVRCRAHNRLHAETVFGREHVASRIDLRRRKSKCIRASNDQAKPISTGVDLALRGLVNMGFAKSDAERALEDVLRRHEASAGEPSIPDLLRETIRALS